MTRYAIILTGCLMMLVGCNETTPQKSEVQETNTVAEVPPSVLHVTDESRLPVRKVETKTLEDLNRVLESIDYTEAIWHQRNAVIPRLYLQRISCRWSAQSSKIPVKAKKQIFFQLITPAILRANELIQLERNRLIEMMKEPVDVEEEAYEWLSKLAHKYKVLKKRDNSALSEAQMQMLLRRVDTIPLSLALAQAAEESGWGTSRFAAEGNALFGQWTFGKNAMIPKAQRTELGNYGLKRFKTPQDSVNSYMLNLNSNNAYKRLRERRESLRRSGKAVTGLLLAETLDKYSERGYEYVKGIKKMIQYNRLAALDTARLWDKEVIEIHPKKIRKQETQSVAQEEASQSAETNATSEANASKRSGDCM